MSSDSLPSARQYLERATARLKVVVPATLLIFVLLYMIFQRFDEALLIMATLPFALVVVSGCRGRSGTTYRSQARSASLHWPASPRNSALDDLLEAIREGAVLRVRPKAMTVSVIIAGLIPIMIGSGAGSEVMQRIAAPMVGGMVTAPLLSMFVVPAGYLLIRTRLVARR